MSDVNATDQVSESVSVGSNGDIYVDEFNRNAVARALNLKDYGEIKKNQDQIKRLIEWAKVKGAKDYTDITNSIKELANRVGSPKLGNNWAQHLSQYAYLEMERMKIDEQLREMEPHSVKLAEEREKENATIKKTSTA
jgi:hypothetical protein